jgi:hypothetical protein
MDAAKNTQNKSKRKEPPLTPILRASLFIMLGLLIVYLYYLSTEDRLLKQVLVISSAFVTFFTSIPQPILILIGYTMLIFYIGYLVGKKKK